MDKVAAASNFPHQHYNLNKACLKDKFFFPNIDMLADTTGCHSIFSSMDGFTDYNLIMMNPLDAEKTVFGMTMKPI